jgi:hypothetical protein
MKRISAISLSFQDLATEEHYQDFQFEIMREGLYKRWGTHFWLLSITCLVLVFLYIEDLKSLQRSGATHDRSVLSMRMVSWFPFTIYSFYYLFRIQTREYKSFVTRRHLASFTKNWIWLMSICETMVAYQNDTSPQYEGCEAKRFRCPYSFSSSIFVTRTAVLSCVLIFNLSTSLGFGETVYLSLVLLLPCRICGFAMFQENLDISIWSSTNLSAQLLVLLACRYMQDLASRKQFRLHLQLADLRSEMQAILDTERRERKPSITTMA